VFIYRKEFFVVLRDVAQRFKLLWLIALIGLVAARVLYLKDNAYQFLFISHIIATFFIWLMYLVVISKRGQQTKFYLFGALFLSALWVIKPLVLGERPVDIFHQNGNYVYDGKKYSKEYLSGVINYFDQTKYAIGGYICDTSFYKKTYYSRRNPNVYFPPVTYVVSSEQNRNFEFCLSNPSDVLLSVSNPVHKDYLENAVQRSFFQQFLRENALSDPKTAVVDFIRKFSLSYIIVTRDYILSPLLQSKVKTEIIDSNTGERFLILQ
jgi:hypothetical protein